ncbi:cell envelope biogenesis protein TolA [Rhodoblastus sp.]|uniref:cell envelope biogenesis protein TolA n=1 Tax=Rhodoblastus sp. TaxID=1962975 RepID=UPI003F9B86B5
MTFSRSEPGFGLSAAIHFGLLAAMLVAFSQDRKFDDAQEAIPVETITDSQFSQIMKGEKTAKEATGKPRVDRVADVSEPKPTPPTPEAKHDVPTPPPPLKRLPDPGEAEDQPTPTPPPLPAPTPPAPPQRPAPPKPAAEAPPQEDKAEREKDDAEPVKPPVRPKPPEKAEQKPKPPTPRPEPKPAPKPPKLDEVAKLLAESKDKAPAKPKSGEESNDRRTPDLAEISRMLSREPPKALGSVGRELNKTASLGAPNASAAKMSPSLSDALNGLLMEQYKACWSYLPLSNGPKYVPWIRVSYRPDGSLAGEPVLTNPPSDPVSRALADSAMRAVRRCNPLKIPARFQPFYDQWKDWKVGFDPVILN